MDRVVYKFDLKWAEKSIPKLITQMEVIVLNDTFEELYRYALKHILGSIFSNRKWQTIL